MTTVTLLWSVYFGISCFKYRWADYLRVCHYIFIIVGGGGVIIIIIIIIIIVIIIININIFSAFYFYIPKEYWQSVVLRNFRWFKYHLTAAVLKYNSIYQ